MKIFPANSLIRGADAITTGPDAAVWFTMKNSIGRITTSGVVSSFTDPSISAPADITVGSDGAMWFTNQGSFQGSCRCWVGSSIGRITTAGVVSSFTDPSIIAPVWIASGPDGALWFTNAANNSIGRITTFGVVASFTSSASGLEGIAAGSDGALWFAAGGDLIGRITTGGSVSRFDGNGLDDPAAITVGSDGAMWFTNTASNTGSCNFPNPACGGSIGRITISGVVSNFTDPTISLPEDITIGSDGVLWFTNAGNNSIGRITTGGVVSNFTDPTISDPVSITPGPDGALWFTNTGNSSIGRITTTGTVSSYPAPGTTPASITAGPDGSLWFTSATQGNPTIGRITTDGVVTTFPSSGHVPTHIASGTDGRLWATNSAKPGSIERFTISGAETDFFSSNFFEPRDMVSGPDAALWFSPSNGGSIGRISTAGSLTFYSDPRIGGTPGGITPGPDGAMWFTNGDSIGRMTTADSVVSTPDQGPSAAAETISGAGFNPGEAVAVKYLTGQPSPPSVPLCTTTAGPDGTFTCTASIPSGAGNPGTHTIKATGKTSNITAKTVFLLTG